jgi:hypothetical protein
MFGAGWKPALPGCYVNGIGASIFQAIPSKGSSMQLMSKTVAPSLQALLERLIDYAGIYPPASVTLDTAVENYGSYRNSSYSWMLRWLVVGAAEVPSLPKSLDGSLSVLAEADDSRAASIEAKNIVHAAHPVYCEVAVGNLEQLDAVKQSGCFAKIRTGGVKPEAIPSPAQVAAFITACAERKLPFKATAGLHHPIRAEQALTYEPDAPRAIMHGFLNVAMASAFAWHGERDIESILAEMEASAFRFDDRAHWRNKSLDAGQIRQARLEFMHSIGSCSFDEPVQELQQFGFLAGN